MFTGIVQTLAKVHDTTEYQQRRQLTLQVEPHHLEGLELGASIAVNGCCLTVAWFDHPAGLVRFDVIDETLRLTNLGGLTPGARVNFERSLTLGQELGGHIVSGHIHTTAVLRERIEEAGNCRMLLELPADWLDYILPKGFVAVDGASLTVGETTTTGFWLHLIPETLAWTTLGEAQPGAKFNIEADQQTITTVTTVRRVLARERRSDQK